MAKKKPQVQIEYRSISELEKLGGNPRYIKEDDMARLKQSINDNPDYFECRPVVLSDRTGSLVIIDGNQRMEAAKLLGWDEVPTVLLHGLSENREREIVIRANVTNGKWDWDILANEQWGSVEELGSWGVECSFLAHDEESNLDDFFEEVEEGDAKKEKKIEIKVCIPEEEADAEDAIRELLKEALSEYPNITLK